MFVLFTAIMTRLNAFKYVSVLSTALISTQDSTKFTCFIQSTGNQALWVPICLCYVHRTKNSGYMGSSMVFFFAAIITRIYLVQYLFALFKTLMTRPDVFCIFMYYLQYWQCRQQAFVIYSKLESTSVFRYLMYS